MEIKLLVEVYNITNREQVNTGEHYTTQKILRERFNIYSNAPLAEVWIE